MNTSFTQRRLGVRLSFGFADDGLTYGLRDYSGERQFTVPYEAINVAVPGRLSVNAVAVYRLLLVLPILLIGLSIALQSSNRALGQALTVLAILSFALLVGLRYAKLLAIRYTLLQMSPIPPGAASNSLRIIVDKQHGAIIEELKTRWRTRMRQLHGAINFSNDVEKEIAKFTWMKDRAVISDREYRDAVEKLRAYQAQLGQQQAIRTLN